jgi:hypothetical protein
MKEIWKQVPGYKGKYEVSSFGRMKGPRGVNDGVCGSNGYMQTTINDKTRNIHVVVCESFIGPRPEGSHICHNDGNKKNNNLQNLRYGTPKENWSDFRLHNKKTSHNISKETCKRGHPLIGKNLRKHSLKLGWRVCVSCDKASKHLKGAGSERMQKISNQYYERITNDNS